MKLNKGQIVFIDKPFISYSEFTAGDLGSSEPISFLFYATFFTPQSHGFL